MKKRPYTYTALFSLLIAVGLLAGCSDDPSSANFEARVLSLLGGIEEGETLTLRGTEAEEVFLPGGDDGSEYLMVPFFASDDGEAMLDLTVDGTDVLSVGTDGAASASSQQMVQTGFGPDGKQSRMQPLSEAAARHGATGPGSFHDRLRAWEQGPGTRYMQSPAWPTIRAQMQARAARAKAVPAVGETLTLRTANPAAANICVDPLIRSARVAAVTDRAIIAIDEESLGSLTQTQIQQVGTLFDELVWPVDTRNFGEPTDLDANDRVIVFFTPVVNQIGEGVGGFFSPADLFARDPEGEDQDCPASNEGEIFYNAIPPADDGTGAPLDPGFVVRSATSVVAHELQHLINASRRIYVNEAQVLEEPWLNEGLSHIAEELIFYEATSLEPRQNIGIEALTADQATVDAANGYMIQNFLRFFTYLVSPDEESLLGVDNLATRGASWAFLRYAADQEDSPDQEFFFDLVNATNSGIGNLNQVLTEFEAIELIQRWVLSVYTDDLGAADSSDGSVLASSPLLQQPSWNYRSVLSALAQNGEYPLATVSAASGPVEVTLLGGGAVFVLARSGPGVQGRITTALQGAGDSGNLRVTLLRLP